MAWQFEFLGCSLKRVMPFKSTCGSRHGLGLCREDDKEGAAGGSIDKTEYQESGEGNAIGVGRGNQRPNK